MTSPPGGDAGPEPAWWIWAAGEVWGPFPLDRMRAFVSEGRLSSRTRAAAAPEGPFRPAGESPLLQTLFAAAVPPGSVSRTAPPSRPEPEQGLEKTRRPGLFPVAGFAGGAARAEGEGTAEPSGRAAQRRSFLVYAECTPSLGIEIASVLGESAAQATRLGAGLWLARSALSAAEIRNRLSRGRGGDDRLLVVEAGLDAAAWFNLDADDRAIRSLWAPPDAHAAGPRSER